MSKSKRNKSKVSGFITHINLGNGGNEEIVITTDDGDVFFLDSDEGLIDPVDWCDLYVEVHGYISQRRGRHYFVFTDIREETSGHGRGASSDTLLFDSYDDSEY